MNELDSEILKTYVVKIKWPAGGEEIVPLGSLNNFEPGLLLRTYEVANGWEVRYSVVVDSLEWVGSEKVVVRLRYAESQNPGLVSINAYWGISTITIDLANETASASFLDNRNSPEFDANEKAELIVEKCITQRAKRLVQVSVRDQKFRTEIRTLDNECAITGESTAEVLDVAHILEVANKGNDGFGNCFLVRTDLHRLFDAGILRFDAEGFVEIGKNSKLSADYKKLLVNKRIKTTVFNRVRENLSVRMKRSIES